MPFVFHLSTTAGAAVCFTIAIVFAVNDNLDVEDPNKLIGLLKNEKGRFHNELTHTCPESGERVRSGNTETIIKRKLLTFEKP